MMSDVLELIFTTTDNKTKTITVAAPMPNLSEADVRAAMEQMIASEIFRKADAPINGVKAARYVSRSVTSIV